MLSRQLPPLPSLKTLSSLQTKQSKLFFTATESGQSSHAIPAAPFPPLPKDTQQLPNETIEAFFIRRRESNDRRMANENPTQRQRRISLAEHAKSGAVPKKAYVFVWENQNGHWIRHMQIRGEFPDLWSEYPGPERRFDPFRNEWDLCTLFRNNDPVFGQGFDSEPDDSDSDMDYDPPTFAQNIDMNSQLAREREILPEMLVAENLLDTLKRRFGFVMPPSPETFVPANPPHEKFDLQHLADIVGMTEYDVSAELASHKGLRTILGTFFGQCLECRTQLSIDKRLLDIWTEGSWPASPFEISREYLTSRQNPAERCYYYVLRRRGSGIGSEVLLMPRATDFLEILRQQWGPDIRDVVRHLLGRGIRFWLALMSAEIKEKSKPAPAGLRPKGYKTDTSTGLGFRPQGYTFGARDYKGYIIERDLRLLHTPRARIALQYGGLIARLARSEVHDEDFFRGFDDDIYDIGDCLWDGTSPYAYWYDRLSDNEVDVLCGVYHVGTGT
ncbi:hypothetical protein DFH06DRAFT_985233 [Mycena polygramma]|nr:hypothetical protein DFH06DRAFT_985233 [Mycena polygramma]